MTAYNAVRFKVKAGMEEAFINGHRDMEGYDGFEEGALIKTGDRTYCFVGRWKSMDKLAASRPELIKSLDGFRDLLEDLGGGLGVTDPVSGNTVAEFRAKH